MGAPRKHKITVTAAGTFQAEVPRAKGDKRRIRRTFQTKAQAQVWLTAAYAALDAGQPVPEPAATVLARASAEIGTPFQDVADKYADERFQYANSAGGDRELQVRADLERMAAWFHDRGLCVEDIRREHVRDLLTDVAKPQQEQADTDHIDPDATIRMVDAEKLYARSTIKRRIAAGEITTTKDHKGRLVLNLAETHRACGSGDGSPLRRGPRGRGLGYDRLDDFRRTLVAATDFARTGMGISTAGDLGGLPTPRSQSTPQKKAAPVSLEDAAKIASHLHAVHQLVLWLLRVLGVRISEAYGIHIQDISDLGEDQPGVIHVHRQGGRAFHNRTASGTLEKTRGSQQLKTASSERHIVVPRPLMSLIRTAIAVFHTDELGIVDPEARLIPELTIDTVDHQGAFRRALRDAAKKAGVGASERALLEAATKPHDMRSALVSQLTDRDLPEVAKRRWFGHVPGSDVHLGSYYKDDPNLRAAMKVNDALEADLVTTLPAGLMIPTATRCTTATHAALHSRADELDTALAGLGWLVERDARGDRLYGTSQVATELGIAQSTARRYIAAFVPNAYRTKKGEWRLTWVETETLRQAISSMVRVDMLATAIGLTIDQTRASLNSLGATVVLDGDGETCVEAAGAARLVKRGEERSRRSEEYATLPEAAAILGVSVGALLTMADEGRLAIHQTAHGPRVPRARLRAGRGPDLR